VSPDQLSIILPLARPRAGFFSPIIANAMAEFGIAKSFDRAAFIANIGHETGQLTTFSENLNYSPEGLLNTWPKRFTPALAEQMARRPQEIANFVYGGRYGNGNAASGDGWRYRGGGGIQTTFRDNYVAGANAFGMDVGAFADWIRTPEGAIRSAGQFWQAHGISARAAAGDFDGCCDLVNLGHKTDKVGDSNGWAERLAMFTRAMQVLA
jgi:putative chitinase